MWYSVKLLFKSIVDDEENIPPLCEESIRLVQANNEEEARNKSEQLGRDEEHEYKNELNQAVSWRFIKIMEVQDLCEPSIYDGIEVYSRLFRQTGTEAEPDHADDTGNSLPAQEACPK